MFYSNSSNARGILVWPVPFQGANSTSSVPINSLAEQVGMLQKRRRAKNDLIDGMSSRAAAEPQQSLQLRASQLEFSSLDTSPFQGGERSGA